MNIAIYIRKSISGDEKSISLKSQEEECIKYFPAGASFTTYIDNGFSGKNTSRPNFTKLIDDVSMGLFDTVVCYKFDRIARNTLDFLTTLELFKKYNTDLISITEGYDPRTPQGKMMITLLASLAEMERENIRQRVTDSMYSLVQKGRYSGGTTPTGYVIDKTPSGSFLKLIDRDKIDYIFSSFLNGTSHNDIARTIGLTSKGIKLILRNPLYMKSSPIANEYLKTLGYEVITFESRIGMGYLTYGKKGYGSKKIAVISTHEAIVEPSDWIQIQNKLKSIDGHKFPRISSKTWLAQLVRCSICGKYLITKTITNNAKNSSLYLKCSCKCHKKYLNASKAEKCILDKLDTISISKEHLMIGEGNLIESEVSSLQKNIVNKEKQIKNLISNLEMVTGSAAQRIISRIEILEDELLNLTSQKKQKMIAFEHIDFNKIHFDSTEELKRFLINFKSLPILEQQQHMRNLFGYLEFDGENILIP